jgi:hypothetical protein
MMFLLSDFNPNLGLGLMMFLLSDFNPNDVILDGECIRLMAFIIEIDVTRQDFDI